MAQAATLIESGDFSAARSKLLAAKALLAGMPDATGKGVGMQWNRESIDTLITTCERELARPNTASRGVRRTLVEYRRPVSDGSY